MTSTLKTSTRQAGRRAFASRLTANVVSLAGTRLSMVALPWFVLTTTGSAAKTGLVGFAEMLPYVVAKAAGGPVIDRVGARKVSVIADIASVVAVGTVPALHCRSDRSCLRVLLRRVGPRLPAGCVVRGSAA
jgi:MFS family permease